jgi:MFS family permease
MGRFTATAVHLSVCLVGGVLYFLFVLPRWWELMGDTSHTLGTVLRIVTGLVIALAALPVLLTLIRTRKPEFATPQLALRLRLWSVILHVAAGALIVATAVAEIWVSLGTAGPWLFGVYGAAAALAILGIVAFYLAFVAEQPPKPAEEKKPRKKRGKKAEAEAEETTEAEAEETTGTDEAEAETEESTEAEETEAPEEPADDEKPAEISAEARAESEAEPEPGGLRNKRPSGKTTHRLRRRNRGGVALDD